MIYAQSRISPGKWDAQTSRGFWDTKRSPNLAQTTRFSDSQQKREPGLGDLGSIPGRVILKTQTMILGTSLINTQHYKVRIKVKWSNPGKGVAPSSTPWCSSYRKRSLRVTLDLKFREQVETKWTSAFVILARILRRFPKTWGNLLSLKLPWKTISCFIRER